MNTVSTVKFANPAPLGLLGFGLTTVLLNLVNAGVFGLDAMILSMGFAYGGLAQIIAGLLEYRRGNTFGTVVFTSYGLFWWSLIMLLFLPRLSFLSPMVAEPSPVALGAYFLMWAIFTVGMLLGVLKTSRALQFVFVTVTILFFLLAIREFTNNPTIYGTVTLNTIVGAEGVVCGFSAVYLAIAEVLNEVYKKAVLPTYPLT